MAYNKKPFQPYQKKNRFVLDEEDGKATPAAIPDADGFIDPTAKPIKWVFRSRWHGPYHIADFIFDKNGYFSTKDGRIADKLMASPLFKADFDLVEQEK